MYLLKSTSNTITNAQKLEHNELVVFLKCIFYTEMVAENKTYIRGNS